MHERGGLSAETEIRPDGISATEQLTKWHTQKASLSLGAWVPLPIQQLMYAISPQQKRSPLTGAGGSHQDNAHLLRNGLRLVGAIGKAAFQILHSGFELSDHILQARNSLFCDGSHCDCVY